MPRPLELVPTKCNDTNSLAFLAWPGNGQLGTHCGTTTAINLPIPCLDERPRRAPDSLHAKTVRFGMHVRGKTGATGEARTVLALEFDAC